MTTPLTREAVDAMLDECGSPDCITCEYATALLAAWEERDGLRKEFDAVVAMLSEMHGAEYSRAEAAEEDITTYQEIVSAMTQDAEAAEAKLAERDAENARLREALEPSGDTKAAYMGEVKDPETKRTVSWTAIKMIMKMISDRAATTGDKP